MSDKIGKQSTEIARPVTAEEAQWWVQWKRQRTPLRPSIQVQSHRSWLLIVHFSHMPLTDAILIDGVRHSPTCISATPPPRATQPRGAILACRTCASPTRSVVIGVHQHRYDRESGAWEVHRCQSDISGADGAVQDRSRA